MTSRVYLYDFLKIYSGDCYGSYDKKWNIALCARVQKESDINIFGL